MQHMCGISGCIDPQLQPENIQRVVRAMTQSQAHRGPDHAGFWFDKHVGLGHRRLKIIDLSDEANQPFETDTCYLVFNGEIYNYVELRKELIADGFRFKTQSDTEVILAAYLRWGTQCSRRFVGMWAFALWDGLKQELFCSRDRFGIKPFYFISDNDRFYFASEYRSLKITPVFRSKLNEDQLKRGLFLGWTNYETETYYSCINSLLPGHNLLVSRSGLKLQRYWSLENPAPESGAITGSEQNAHFYELFKQSLLQHIRSDVPVGACLSGGLDSSSIASMYSMLYPQSQLQTFTIYYTGSGNVDERPFANEVARKYRSVIAPHYHMPNADEVQQEFQRAADHSETPLIGSSYLSQYFVMKQASAHGIKVMLDGQGSDEYLAGYMHSFYRWMAKYFVDRKWRAALNLMFSHHNKHQLSWKEISRAFFKGLYLYFRDEEAAFRAQLNSYKWLLRETASLDALIQLPKKSVCKVNNFTYHMLFTTSLPTLLHYEDRFSMAFSIESRVPFLDHRLVEYIYHLNPDYKISREAETKFILRQSLRRILPQRIRQRHDKRAFTTPGETQWLRGFLNPLLHIDYSSFDWLNIRKVKNLMEDYRKGDNSHANLVWRLATFNYWMKNYA